MSWQLKCPGLRGRCCSRYGRGRGTDPVLECVRRHMQRSAAQPRADGGMLGTCAGEGSLTSLRTVLRVYEEPTGRLIVITTSENSNHRWQHLINQSMLLVNAPRPTISQF